MQRPRSGVLLCLVAVVAAVTAMLVVPGRTWTAAGASVGAGGRLDAPDRDVLFLVKRANLWEVPVGQWLAERGSDPRVRDAGARISAEHRELNRITDEVAARLGVDLPVEPSTEQQGWMGDIEGRSGADLDRRAVFLLREAHGQVLPLLAQVRAGTRNAEVRRLTGDGMAFVQRHIQYLESTGLVRYEQLSHPADLGMNDWRLHTVTFAVFALLVALLVTLFLLIGRVVAGLVARRRAPPPTYGDDHDQPGPEGGARRRGGGGRPRNRHRP